MMLTIKLNDGSDLKIVHTWITEILLLRNETVLPNVDLGKSIRMNI